MRRIMNQSRPALLMVDDDNDCARERTGIVPKQVQNQNIATTDGISVIVIVIALIAVNLSPKLIQNASISSLF